MCTIKLRQMFDKTKDEVVLLIGFLVDHSVLLFSNKFLKHCVIV
jgi:hypothetical protein